MATCEVISEESTFKPVVLKISLTSKEEVLALYELMAVDTDDLVGIIRATQSKTVDEDATNDVSLAIMHALLRTLDDTYLSL